jgi:hypothetical protein
MKLYIRNSVKNINSAIFLIIKHLRSNCSDAKADIYAIECRIHNFDYAL